MAVWLIIALAVVLILGPIAWSMPTRRDRMQKRLRDEARKLELTVQMRQLPHPSPTPEDQVSAGGVAREPTLEVAAYIRALRLPTVIEARHAPSWRVLYDASGRHEGGAMLPTGWRFDHAGFSLTDRNLEQLGALLARTPRGTVGVECNEQLCALYWREREAEHAVATIRDVLAEFAVFEERLAREYKGAAEADP